MVLFYQNIMKQLAVATQKTTPSADDMEVDHDSDDDEKMEVDNDDGQNGRRSLNRKRDATWIITAKTTAKRPSKKIRSSSRVKSRRVAVVATWKKPNARMRKICRTIYWPTSPVIETRSKTSNAEAMEVDWTFPDIPACQLIVKSFYDATVKDFRRRYVRRNKGTITERMEVD
jgi:hypothetical protein